MEVFLDLDIRLLPFDAFKISVLLSKLILIIYRFIVSQNTQYKSYVKKTASTPWHVEKTACRPGHVQLQLDQGMS